VSGILYDHSYRIITSVDTAGKLSVVNRETENKNEALSCRHGSRSLQWQYLVGQIAAPAGVGRRRLCSADLFNKSIGRQSYSCQVRPSRPASLSDIAPVVNMDFVDRATQSVYRVTARHDAAFPVSEHFGTFLSFIMGSCHLFLQF